MEPLKDQIAVITGASSGIGKAISIALASKGVKLCLLGRNLETLESVAEVAREFNGLVRCYRVDLTVDQYLSEFVEHIREDFEYVDVLVHGAGVISLGRLDSAPVKDFDWQYLTNLRVPYLLTQALLPLLRQGQSQIVFINSSAGLKATGNVGQYAATKHALKAIADSFRQEINPEGLRVLSLYLGRTATPMQEAVFKSEGRSYQPDLLMQPEDVATMVISALSLPRSAEVTEISMRPLIKSY
jgi:NADP-dependent 3-hydroxy acid dehydrogenase YdfG